MSANEIFMQAVSDGQQVIEVTDAEGVQYVAVGLKGASPTAEAFKCSAVFPIENGRHVRHAEGLHAPGWGGVNLPTLIYLPVEA